MTVYPWLSVAVIWVGWVGYTLARRRIRRDLPLNEQLTATRLAAARINRAQAVVFLLLALAGALIFGARPGPWVTVLVNAGLGLWSANRARYWQQRAGAAL